MSNKDARLSKIKKIRDRYTFLSTSACIAAVVAVVFSPAIPVTIAVTAVGASIGLFGVAKNEKLNEEERILLLDEKA